MPAFQITEPVFALFPRLLVGVVAARDIDNAGESAAIMTALRAEEERRRGAVVAEHPHVLSWRDAYRAFGAKPKDYASSIENLMRRAGKGHSLPHINKLVDLYNTISLRHELPAGGEDMDHIEGDILLKRASAGEPAVRLLGESEERAPHPGEVIYSDDSGAICRRFNWKEADRTRLTEQTRNAVMVLEVLPPFTEVQLRAALDDLAASVLTHCGGIITSAVLTSSESHILL